MEEVTTGWRKLHNEERHDLYLLPNNILATKRRTLIWDGKVALIEEKKNV
jgi:hypothetical protein